MSQKQCGPGCEFGSSWYVKALSCLLHTFLLTTFSSSSSTSLHATGSGCVPQKRKRLIGSLVAGTSTRSHLTPRRLNVIPRLPSRTGWMSIEGGSCLGCRWQSFVTLSCRARCVRSLNHMSDNIPHEAGKQHNCQHKDQYDNCFYLCKVRFNPRPKKKYLCFWLVSEKKLGGGDFFFKCQFLNWH
jgi:hypothetical protein